MPNMAQREIKLLKKGFKKSDSRGALLISHRAVDSYTDSNSITDYHSMQNKENRQRKTQNLAKN